VNARFEDDAMNYNDLLVVTRYLKEWGQVQPFSIMWIRACI